MLFTRWRNVVGARIASASADKLSAPPESSALTARNNACARLACNPVRHGPKIRATIFLACMARSALRLDNEKRSTTGHACVVFTQTLLRKKLIRYNNMRGNLRVCSLFLMIDSVAHGDCILVMLDALKLVE